jgi:DNA (cytosine-5)-methyltransferase 1
MTIKIIDLFAGIGGIRLGFEPYGCECVFSSEWDADAQKMYEANYGHKPHGDITQIAPEDIPNHDILLGGFPCQPFSIIGKSLGFADTRGTLFFNIEEILRVKKPYAFLLENVKQLRSHDQGRTLLVIKEKLEALGYFVHIKILNALDFGLPQKRERIIIVGFQENLDFKGEEIKKSLQQITQQIFKDNFLDNENFNFYLTKKSKLIEETLQTENV